MTDLNPLHGVWRAIARTVEPAPLTRAAFIASTPPGQAAKYALAVLEMWDAGLLKLRRDGKTIELTDLGRARLVASGLLISEPARFTVDPSAREFAIRCSCGWSASVDAFQTYSDPEAEVRVLCANHARDAHVGA